MASIFNTAKLSTGGIGPISKYTSWVDFTGVTVNTGQSIQFNCTLPNAGLLKMDMQSISGYWSPRNSSGQAFSTIAYFIPSFSNAMGFDSCTTAQLNFNNIQILDSNSNPTTRNWFLVFGDAEVTEQGSEYLRWVTDGTPWINWTTVPTSGAPLSIITGVGTTTITNDGTLASGGSVHVSPIAITSKPSNIQLYVKTACTESSFFGVGVERIDLQKTVDLSYGKFGDILTYTIALTNVAITNTLTNLTFIDTLPSSVSYISNSLTLNSSSYNPSNSFPTTLTLPDMLAQQIATISYKVQVMDDSVSSIPNIAYASGFQGALFDTSLSNIVSTTILNPNLITVKSVDKSFANASDTITYTVIVKNTGNQTATSIILTDTLPSTTSYISGSLTGASGGAPPTINISNLAPGAIATLTFKALLSTLPNPTLTNVGYLKYNYIYNSSTSASTTASTITNSVVTTTKSPIINNLNKVVDSNYAFLNDILTYTISFSNTGNDTAYTVTFIDTLPNEVTFLPNSLFVDGTNLLSQSPEPPGINLSSIPAGSTTTISFKVTVTSVPTNNKTTNQGNLIYYSSFSSIPNTRSSNVTTTSIVYINTPITKSVDRSVAQVGDILTYTIPIFNNSNVAISNIHLIDTLPIGVSLVSNSIYINGILQSGNLTSPGITLPNMNPGFSITVTFKALVVSLPQINPIQNIGEINYNYIFDPTTTPYSNIVNSNIVQTNLLGVDFNQIKKMTSNVFSTVGQTISYTVIIPNTGNINATNCLFIDTVPSGTSFVPNSLTINNITTSYTPDSVPLGTLSANSVVTISYILLIN